MRNRVPSLRRHKASAQGIVTLSGRDIYLGVWPIGQKTPPADVEAAYRKAIAGWLATGFPSLEDRPPPVVTRAGHFPAVSVEQILAAFLTHAGNYYRHPDGEPTGELTTYKSVMKTVRRLYGTLPAVEFGPLALKAVRQDFIDQGLARTVCNNYTARVRIMFKWAAGEQLIPGSVVHALSCVGALKAGRCDARETLKVIPPDQTIISDVLNVLPKRLSSMFRVMQYSGMRVGELVAMRAGDITRKGDVWKYTVRRHKTAWRGKSRVVMLGGSTQLNLKPHLEGLTPDDFVFSPRRMEEERIAERTAGRKTPRWKSHLHRNARKRKRKPKRAAGDAYTPAAVGRLLQRACAKRYPLPDWLARLEGETPDAWRERIGEGGRRQVEEHRRLYWFSPHALRHWFATHVRKSFGLEAARAALGHTTAKMTEHYAEMDEGKAREAAEFCG